MDFKVIDSETAETAEPQRSPANRRNRDAVLKMTKIKYIIIMYISMGLRLPSDGVAVAVLRCSMSRRIKPMIMI